MNKRASSTAAIVFAIVGILAVVALPIIVALWYYGGFLWWLMQGAPS